MSASVLQRPTLVLNRSWQPIHVGTVARSLQMLWNDTAMIVNPNTYETYGWEEWTQIDPKVGELFVGSVNLKICAPEVITLTKYDKTPVKNVSFSRRNLFRRDQYTCQYCGVKPGSEELTIDHILPRSRSGMTNWVNCVLACVNCNKRKANKLPTEAHMKLIREPGKPRWGPLYGTSVRIESWQKFISEAYWNIALDEEEA